MSKIIINFDHRALAHIVFISIKLCHIISASSTDGESQARKVNIVSVVKCILFTPFCFCSQFTVVIRCGVAGVCVASHVT